MGNYVDSVLMKDEKVLYETRLHWIIFLTFRSVFTLGIAPFIDFSSSEFAITDRRAILKTGAFSRKTLEMNLQKIESVNVEQGIMGRMFGYGNITIIGTGGTREHFRNISNPLEFRQKFQQLS